MQDKFVGDIGDFVKYGLLRALMPDMKLGVAWYLNHGAKKDGRYTQYLEDRDAWRDLDSELFDRLLEIVKGGSRTVSRIEESGLLGDASFASDMITTRWNNYAWRKKWFDSVIKKLTGCNLVFADPDIGLEDDNLFEYDNRDHGAYITLSEAVAMAKHRTAVIFHHNTHQKEKFGGEIKKWREQLGEGTMVLQCHAYSSLAFFVVNPTPEISTRLTKFESKWGKPRCWGRSTKLKKAVTLHS